MAPERLFFIGSIEKNVIDDDDFDGDLLLSSNIDPQHAGVVVGAMADVVGGNPEQFTTGN
jgi:hypothetical protein